MIACKTNNGLLLRFRVWSPHDFIRDLVYLLIGALAALIAAITLHLMLNAVVSRWVLFIVWYSIYYFSYAYSRFVYAKKRHYAAVKSAFYLFTHSIKPSYLEDIKQYCNLNPMIRNVFFDIPDSSVKLPYERLCVRITPNVDFINYDEKKLVYDLESFFVSYINDELVVEAFCCQIDGSGL